MYGLSILRLALALSVALVLGTGALAQDAPVRAWWDRTPTRASKHYRIQTDLPIAEARAHGRHLDRMYEAYARQLAVLPPREPERMNVYMFARRSDYVEAMSTLWGIDARATGGMFFVNDRGSGLAIWTEALSERRIHHLIQHEGFHQFAYSRFADELPLWISEGLAEFFGDSVIIDDEIVLGQTSPRTLQAVRRAIEEDAYVPLAEMLSMSNDEWRRRMIQGEADLHYAQAWSMVHFLVYGDDQIYQKPFERVLHQVNQGTPAGAAFRAVFGDDVEGFERQWKAYALAARPSSFRTALDRMEFLADGAVALSRAGEREIASLDDLRDRLQVIMFSREIRSHYHVVRLSADDSANFEIPLDHTAASGDARPVFVVEPPRWRRLSKRQQAFEDALPMPPTIRTEGLAPRGLVLRWKRDSKTGSLSYDIDVTRPRRR